MSSGPTEESTPAASSAARPPAVPGYIDARGPLRYQITSLETGNRVMVHDLANLVHDDLRRQIEAALDA